MSPGRVKRRVVHLPTYHGSPFHEREEGWIDLYGYLTPAIFTRWLDAVADRDERIAALEAQLQRALSPVTPRDL